MISRMNRKKAWRFRNARPESFQTVSSGSATLWQANSLADVGFEDTEGLFVPLQCHGQCVPQTLGGVVIQDDPVGHLDFDFAGGVGGWVQPKVENQFFRGAGNAAEIGIAGVGLCITDNDFLSLLVFATLGFFLCFAHARYSHEKGFCTAEQVYLRWLLRVPSLWNSR